MSIEEVTKSEPVEINGKTYQVEWKEGAWSGLQFRVVCSDGQVSGWARYEGVAYVNDVGALTCYYLGDGDDLQDLMPLPIEKVWPRVFTGPESERQPEEDASDEQRADE